MQNIKVKKINSKSGTNKKGQWTSFIVVAEDGAEFTSFDTKLSDVKSGSILSVEPEVKGKYTNIKEWKLVSEPTSTKLNELFPSSSSQAASSMKIACLQEVGLLIRLDIENGMNFSAPEFTARAKKYWQVIDKNLDSLIEKSEVAQDETRAKKQTEKKSVIPDLLSEVRTGAQLFNYAMKHGFTIEQIRTKLGTNNPNDIPDLKIAKETLFPNVMKAG